MCAAMEAQVDACGEGVGRGRIGAGEREGAATDGGLEIVDGFGGEGEEAEAAGVEGVGAPLLIGAQKSGVVAEP